MLGNIQHYQTIILSFILFMGVYFFGLDISVLEISMTFFTVIFFDYLLKNNFQFSKNNVFPYSGVNAAFGICFFLRSEDLILYIFAGILAIFGKYLIQSKGRHFLNPSNMAVFLTLCLFPQYAWVNTLQWGNYTGIVDVKYVLMLCFVLFLGLYMSTRVRKLLRYEYLYSYVFPFFTLHSILFFIIPYYESFSSYLQFFNISFFIFIFFMMTDPRTVPHKSFSRFLYATMMVCWFYLLQFFINENYAILGSLFISTLFLPTIWKYENGESLIYKEINIAYTLLLLCNIVLIFVILVCISIYGQPDLVFDNRCNQLVCR